MVGMRFASMDFPVPGGPTISVLFDKSPLLADVNNEMKKPIAYSYIRFSSERQTDGNSEPRQVDLAQRWAKAKGVNLDMGYIDRGIPSFRGTNRKTGALGKFIAAVKAGIIKKGSYLVVEDPDRLSREHPWDTINTLRNDILAYGIVLVVAKTENEYTEENIRADTTGMKLAMLTLEFGRASSESARKSDLLTKSWEAKRERALKPGGKLTSMAPAWIETIVTGEGRHKDRVFKLIPERVKVVREIYFLHIKGRGTRAIAQILNDRKEPTWGKAKGKKTATHWHSSYISKILANPAVIGEYRPHIFKMIQDPEKPTERKQIRVPTGEVWKNYYDPVIKLATYEKVQAMATERGKRGVTGGRITDEISNLFPGLVFGILPDPLAKNPDTDEPRLSPTIAVECRYKSKGATHGHGKYLVSQTDPINKTRKKSDELKPERWSYLAVEYAILTTLQEINWRTIVGESKTPEQAILAENAAKLEATARELREECRNIGSVIAKTPFPTLVEQLSEMEQKRKTASDAASDARKKLERLELDRGGLIQPLEIEKAAHDPKQKEIRLALRAELARRINSIRLLPKKLAPKKDQKRDRITQVYSFQISIDFVNGITRVCRVRLNKGSNPTVSPVAFQKYEGKPLSYQSEENSDCDPDYNPECR